MRAWLIRASWWQRALLLGSYFGLVMALNARYLQGESWSHAAVGGLLSGIFFGAVMGPITARLSKRYRAEAGDENLDRLAGLGWFGWRRKVADDPDLRAAARRVTLLQRDQLLRQRPWAIPFFVLVLALDVWLSVTQSRWWWLAGVFFAAMLVAHLLMPRRLERRAEELHEPEVAT